MLLWMKSDANKRGTHQMQRRTCMTGLLKGVFPVWMTSFGEAIHLSLNIHDNDSDIRCRFMTN